MQTQSYWRSQNFSYRDKDYSPAKGVSLWETCPQLAALDPGVAFTFLDDFFQFKLVSSDESGWISTEIEAGTGDAAITSDDQAGGVLKVVTDDADNDGVQLQWNAENFKLASGKPLWFEARVKFADATQSDFLVGLGITDTTLLGGLSDGVYFRKDDGDANIDFVTEKNSTETATDTTADAADNTWVKLGFWFDGASSVYAYVDGVLKATHTTNICDDEELAVSFAYLNGAAGADTFYIDYVKVVAIR